MGDSRRVDFWSFKSPLLGSHHVSHPPGDPAGRPYTEEQVVACRAILHAKRKGHYEVLSVTRTATDDEIKRSYRKLALRFHVRPWVCVV